MEQKETIGIIGCGLVGQSWAIVFSTAGYNVRICDNEPDRLMAGMAAIRSKMAVLEGKEALRGQLGTEDALKQIKPAHSIKECVEQAAYIQECVFEDFDLKRSVIEEVVKYLPSTAIVGSSTGNFFPSRLSDGLHRKERIVVAHPLNPVHLVPLVEIIPAPWTHISAITETRRILADAGQEPIVAKKETHGFIICRIQHTITAECFKLIRDDVISVADLEKLFPCGLGLRYAYLGALETSYLNANGMKEFSSLYGDALYRLQEESGPPIRLDGAPLDKIQEELEKSIPLSEIEVRRKWRDERLVDLFKLKNKKSEK